MEEAKILNSRSAKFHQILDRLYLPLRYSILALLSNSKVSIHSEKLVKFMRHLQTQEKWNSERYADYGAYLID